MSPICRSEKPKHLAFCRRSASQSHLTRKQKKIKRNSEKNCTSKNRKWNNEKERHGISGFFICPFFRQVVSQGRNYRSGEKIKF